MDIIKFYKVNDEYGCFSNFAPAAIFEKGERWPTAEHYFQANKFLDSQIRENIRNLNSPMQAANEGRSRKYTLRPDWEQVKDSVMYNAVYLKFLQNHELKEILLNTANRIIVEHTDNDHYWGDGGDGTGLNQLGKTLMLVREKIRSFSEQSDLYLPPWIPFSDIEQDDMFWRMGVGENYMAKWFRYYSSLSISEKLRYQKEFPCQEFGWVDFYE